MISEVAHRDSELTHTATRTATHVATHKCERMSDKVAHRDSELTHTATHTETRTATHTATHSAHTDISACHTEWRIVTLN